MTLPTVIISAGSEWRVVVSLFPQAKHQPTPFGQVFVAAIDGQPWRFFQGGWGKISAAASTQYAIDHYRPEVLVNLGTCGGFTGRIARGAIVLAEKTLVYDIIEQMGDQAAHIAHYTTPLDLSWLKQPYPLPVTRSLLVSADRDLLAAELPDLIERYGAVAGDWESGAIAWTAQRNHTRLLILRAVTDLVGPSGGEAYGGLDFFQQACAELMPRLVASLPQWW